MNRFVPEIKLQTTQCGHWRVLECFRLTIGTEVIHIPKGFETDGASIPKLLRFFACPMDIPALKGAIIHDYLYRTRKYTRKECDNIFLEILLIVGTPKVKAMTYYSGVRIGGYFTYKKYKNERLKSHKESCNPS